MELKNDDNCKLRAGGDFFILSRLRSEGKFKFPVETSDFFFGLNLTGEIYNDYSFRMRVSHISSHLVDGYTTHNNTDKTTTFIKEPFVYSREFVDIIFAYKMKYFRPYLGGTTIFSTIPKNINKFVPQIGFDIDYPLFHNFDISVGYDAKFIKVYEDNSSRSAISNSAQVGLKYKLSENTGLSFNFYYYSGFSIHGMFYNNKENYIGYGIQFYY